MTTILSLDDDREVLDVVHLVLEDNGYEHFYTTSSFEAWSILRNEPVDLFTQDWSRPDIDGLTFYQRMKAEVSLYDLPILMLTASDVVMDEATVDLIRANGRPRYVRGFQVAPPNRQSALSLLTQRAGLEIAYVDGYLSKPCTADELLREIERVLNGRDIPLPTLAELARVRRRSYDPATYIVGRKSQIS